MQKNEGIQSSSHEKTLIESFKLIQNMKPDLLPEWIHVSEFEKTDPGVRKVPKSLEHTPWKSHQRCRYLKQCGSIRAKQFQWKSPAKFEAFCQDRRKIFQRKNRNKNRNKSKKNKNNEKIKLVRWTCDPTHDNYDELILNFNLEKLDAELAKVNKWDDKDKAEPGIQIYKRRIARKRKKYREQRYGKYQYDKFDDQKLKEDVSHFRLVACMEVYTLLIDDAPTIAWRCAAMSPVARMWLTKIYGNPNRFSWKDFHFHPVKELKC